MPTTLRDWLRALLVPLTILAWLAVILVAFWLLGHVAKTILTLVLSGVVAFAVRPLVNALSRWMPRTLAVAVAYLVAFAVIFGLGAFLVVTAATQVRNLVDHLPTYQKDIHKFEPQIVQLLSPFGVTSANFHTAEHQAISTLQSTGTAVAKDSLSIVAGIFGTLVDIVLVLILSIYLTANGPRIAAFLRRESPRTQRWRVALWIEIVNQVVGGYIRGQLTLATLVGALVGVGMFALRVHYAVLLGLLAFFMEFVPIVGVLISGAVCVLVALFQGVLLAVLVLAYFVFVHVIEGDVVGPRIMGSAVGIHPATALVALVAGTELFGIWGALFAAPLAGLVQAFGVATWRELRGQDPEFVLNTVSDTVQEAIDTKAEEAAPPAAQAQPPPPPEPLPQSK